MLPGTVHARFRARSDQSLVPASAPSEKVVTFAIECSKPLPMNASSAHHSTASLAPSLLARAAIQSARHTSALQSTARQNSCPPSSAFLDATVLATSSPNGPVVIPPAL